jgi:hypothetical protein
MNITPFLTQPHASPILLVYTQTFTSGHRAGSHQDSSLEFAVPWQAEDWVRKTNAAHERGTSAYRVTTHVVIPVAGEWRGSVGGQRATATEPVPHVDPDGSLWVSYVLHLGEQAGAGCRRVAKFFQAFEVVR